MSGGFCTLSSGVTMDELAIRHGVYVTVAYVLVFYGCIIGQAKAKVMLVASYKADGERASHATPRCYRTNAYLCV